MADTHPSGRETLAGRFVRFSVEDVMMFLGLVRASGVIEVVAPQGEMQVFWVDGAIVSSRSISGGLRLGDLLVHRGKIRPDDIETAWQESVKRKVLLGRSLVDMGFVREDLLEKLLVDQVFENIYRMLTWTPTQFRFVDGAPAPMTGAIVRATVENVLMEGARRLDEWGRLPPVVTEGESVFEVTDEPDVEEKISLSLEEWKLLFLVNGRKRLADIWRASPFSSDLETSRALYGLLSAKLIRSVSHPARTAAPAQEESEPVSVGESTSVEVKRSSKIRPAIVPPRASADGMPKVTTEDAAATLLLSDPVREEETPASTVAQDVETTHEIPSIVPTLQREEIDIRPQGRLISVDAGASAADVFELESDTVTLGRSFENHLVLADGHVSSRHAKIIRNGDAWSIEDLGSHNGILIDGKKIQRATLRGGEEIEIWPYRFRFEIEYRISEAGRRRPTIQLP